MCSAAECDGDRSCHVSCFVKELDTFLERSAFFCRGSRYLGREEYACNTATLFRTFLRCGSYIIPMDDSLDVDAGFLCLPDSQIAVHNITGVICDSKKHRAAVIDVLYSLEQSLARLSCENITQGDQIIEPISYLSRCSRLMTAAITYGLTDSSCSSMY